MKETIGKQIWKQRKASGMSQNDLRNVLELKSVMTISSWENEKHSPTINMLEMMNDKLGWEFNLDYLKPMKGKP